MAMPTRLNASNDLSNKNPVDADFHDGQGWRVEPLPFHGVDDQAYDHLQRPFWSDPPARWTSQRLWLGESLPADHAILDVKTVELPKLRRDNT